MDRSDVINLVSSTESQDQYGVWKTTETKRQVFCQVDSITRQEFFEAGRNGLNPEYKFTMFDGDYNDEKTVEYKGKLYGIYRVYRGRSDRIELYAERKGNHGGGDNGGS